MRASLPIEPRSRTDLIRGLAVASIAGQVIWVAIGVVAGLLEPGYSEIRDAVSVLGARDAAHPWLFDLAVAIWGAAFICAAVALLLDRWRGVRNWLGPALIALTGLAQILDGFPFPADCRWTMDATCRARESAGELSWQHYAHGITYFLGAAFLLLSVFAIAWRVRGDRRWGRFDRFAVWAGGLAVLIFGGLFFLAGNDPNGDYGLVQRLALAAGGCWVALLCCGLLLIHEPQGRPAALAAAGRRRLAGFASRRRGPGRTG